MISHIGKNSQRRNELVDAVTRIIARQSSTDAVLRLPTNDTRPGHVAALQTLVAESYAKQTVICVSDRCRRYVPVIGSRPTNAVLATAARAPTLSANLIMFSPPLAIPLPAFTFLRNQHHRYFVCWKIVWTVLYKKLRSRTNTEQERKALETHWQAPFNVENYCSKTAKKWMKYQGSKEISNIFI